MNRIWINYNSWEDFKAGLYSKGKQEDAIHERVEFMMKNPAIFFEKSMQMIDEWPNSMNHNLSNVKSNRKSYLGQACACYFCGANIMTTCKVWERLSKQERDMANKIADEVIEYYEKDVYPKQKIEVLDEKLS